MTATVEQRDNPVITRYDGTRFITEEEIDREFEGQWVLIGITEELFSDGYLLASAEDHDMAYSELSDIGVLEYDAQATVVFGCKTRGDNLHVELLG